jgi:hypothetical protein
MKRAAVAVLFLLAAACAHAPVCDPSLPFPLTKECLVKRYTLRQAEKEHFVLGRPFGYQNEQWKAFIAQMKPGDELWLYRNSPVPPGSLRPGEFALGFEEGFLILRGCTYVDRLTTLVS